MYSDDGVWGWAMKRAREAELAMALYWCESVIHWMCESRGNAAVVQHVRVIPARLLNLDSHKVIVYGYFSIVNYKALKHFAFSPFVISVNVSAQEIGMEKVFQDLHVKVEKVKFVTRSSIKEFVLYLSKRLMFIFHVEKVQVILRNSSHYS